MLILTAIIVYPPLLNILGCISLNGIFACESESTCLFCLLLILFWSNWTSAMLQVRLSRAFI